MLLQVQRKLDEAVGHYREALRINGDYVDALVDLAWALATSPDPAGRQPEEALRLAERGAQLTRPQTSVVLDVLAASLAAAGRFDEAIATAERAIALATAAKNDREAARYATGWTCTGGARRSGCRRRRRSRAPRLAGSSDRTREDAETDPERTGTTRISVVYREPGG